MQPYFFPYIGYWQLLNAVDKYVIYDDVNYIKGGWINRNRILINGEPKYFNLLLSQASPNKRINEIEILDNPVASKKLLNSLQMNYSRAPYYVGCFPMLESIIMSPEKNLARYLVLSIHKICNYLDIKTEILISSEIEKDNLLKGEEKVLSICEKLGADCYYNAIGGMELYTKEHFAAKGIKLFFLKTNKIVYPQFKRNFIENLSIIDVLMFNSVDKIRTMLGEYELI